MELFPTNAPGFDDPVGVLRACHARIERNLATLLKLPAHLREAGCDAEAREALTRIVRYFTSAAQDHHADEECDLFPLLRELEPGLDAVLGALEAEHQELDAAWRALAPLLGRPEDLPREVAALTVAGEHFAAVYRRHIAREEAQVLAPAASLLSTVHRQRIGAAMAARRGLPAPSAP